MVDKSVMDLHIYFALRVARRLVLVWFVKMVENAMLQVLQAFNVFAQLDSLDNFVNNVLTLLQLVVSRVLNLIFIVLLEEPFSRTYLVLIHVHHKWDGNHNGVFNGL